MFDSITMKQGVWIQMQRWEAFDVDPYILLYIFISTK